MTTFSWIRSLFPNFRRSSDPAVEIIQPQRNDPLQPILKEKFASAEDNQTQPREPSKPSALEREIYRWVDQTVRQAWDEIAAKDDPLLDNLFFKKDEELGRVELWLSACRSGCCCKKGKPETSILISSLDISWEEAWLPIRNALTVINRNRNHSFYHRIIVASYPELPSLDVDHYLAQSVILWSIRPWSGNLIIGLPTEPRVNRDAPILNCGELPNLEADPPPSTQPKP